MANLLKIEQGELKNEDNDDVLQLLDAGFPIEGKAWQDVEYDGSGEISRIIYRKGGSSGEIIADKRYFYNGSGYIERVVLTVGSNKYTRNYTYSGNDIIDIETVKS